MTLRVVPLVLLASSSAIVPESVRRGREAITRDPVIGVSSGATESRKDGLTLGHR